MDFIDLKYCNIISSYLDKSKVKSNSPYRLNFRCPLCGDSKKSKSKARGWLLEDDSNHLHFFCHNCSTSLSFQDFLKEINFSVYDQYIKEKLLEKYGNNNFKKEISYDNDILNQFKVKKPINFDIQKIEGAIKISNLPNEHPAKKYLIKRNIPHEKINLFYYTKKFKEFTNNIVPKKFQNIKNDEPRLIIPFFNKEGKLFGFQGRSFKKNTDIRYITIMIDESQPKVFGLNKIDFNKPYYVVEGPIDSIFLDNSLAMAGASIHYDILENPENCTFVLDNEPRKRETVEKMKKIIDKGFSICLWDKNIKEKDINDMILSGMSQRDIMNSIKEHTFNGLRAVAELSIWRKIK